MTQKVVKIKRLNSEELVHEVFVLIKLRKESELIKLVEDNLGREVEVWYREMYKTGKNVTIKIEVLTCIMGHYRGMKAREEDKTLWEKFGVNREDHTVLEQELIPGLSRYCY